MLMIEEETTMHWSFEISKPMDYSKAMSFFTSNLSCIIDLREYNGDILY